MGQRTQIVVKVIERNTYDNTEKTHIGCYHNQWGIAKMQLMDAINLFNTYINYKGFEFPKHLAKAYLLGEDETCTNPTIEGVMDYLNHQDNNDGGLFIELEVEDQLIKSGKMYIFNDAEREGKPVDRIVSLAEYINYYPEYFNADFYAMFTACLHYHNIELIEQN